MIDSALRCFQSLIQCRHIPLVCGLLLCSLSTIHAQHAPVEHQLVFTKNQGQLIDQFGKPMPEVLYTSTYGGVNVYLTKYGLHYVFSRAYYRQELERNILLGRGSVQPDSISLYRLDMRFLGANLNVRIVAEEQAQAYFNYYLAHCPEGLTSIPSYKKLLYLDLYDGIDMIVYARDSGMRYDFVVHPGADPSNIRMAFEGHDTLTMNADALHVVSPFGELTEDALHIYTHSPDGEQDVTGRFTINGNLVSFDIGSYDRRQTLIIDPTRMWATYYGGGDIDNILQVAIGRNLSVNASGQTLSTSAISTTGAHQATFGGTADVYITQFDQFGTLQWTTYYGGDNVDAVTGLAVDTLNNIIASGSTGSTSAIATTGAYQASLSGSPDHFIVKFNASGVRQWGTYFGGSGNEGQVAYHCVAIDSANNIYTTLGTNSSSGIATTGAFQTTLAGSSDVVLAKFSPAGALLWSSYYGGASAETAGSVAVDRQNNAIIFGGTQSTTGIATTGSFQTTYAGSGDLYIAKFTSTGALQWATYYGGTGSDVIGEAVTDPDNNIYIVGATTSTASIATPASHQPVYGGGFSDGMIVKFNASGGRLWGTYYGGNLYDGLRGVVTTYGNDIYVTGYTLSTSAIITTTAYQSTYGGGNGDAYIGKLTSSGALVWGTYYGGTDSDVGGSVGIDQYNNPIIGGGTLSTASIASSGAHQTTFGGGLGDGFLAKFCDAIAPAAISAERRDTLCAGEGITLTAAAGYTTYQWYRNGTSISGATNQNYTVPLDLPPGLHKYTMHVTTPSSCDGVSDTIFIHKNDTLFLEAGSDWEMCRGTSVIIGNNASRGTSPYSYQWTPSAGLSNPAIARPTATPASTTIYYVRVTDALECETRDSVIVTINPRPSLSAAITEVTICSGEDTVIGAPATGGTPPYIYRWSPSIGLSGVNIAQPIASPPGTMQYTVSVTDSKGCVDSAKITVTVLPAPFPIIQPSHTPTLCGIDTLVLTTQQTFGTYTWNTGAVTRSINVTTPGPYFVIVTDANGCIGKSDTIIVKRGKMPSGNIAGPKSACPNITVNYIAEDSASGGIYTWSITPAGGGNIISGQGTPTIGLRWNTVGSWKVRLAHTSSDGCTKDTVITVTVSDTLKPVIDYRGPTKLCLGDTVLLTVSGYTTYLWSTGETTESIGVTTSGNYSVRVTNSSGCAGTSDAIALNFSTVPKPSPAIIAASPTLCEGDTLLLSSDTDYASYLWSTGEQTRSIRITQGGAYTLTVTNSDGCEGTASFNVTTLPKPSVDVTINGSLTFCDGDSVVLTATPGHASYRWSTGDSVNTIVAKTGGNYFVTVTNAAGCEATSSPLKLTALPTPQPIVSGPTSVCIGSTETYSITDVGSIINWTVTGGTIISGQGTPTISIQWTLQGGATVSVSATDPGNGCTGSTSIKVTIDSSLNPVVTTLGTSRLCEGDSVTLDAGMGYSAYQWLRDGSVLLGDTFRQLRVGTAGNYSVRVISGNCTGSSADIVVTVLPLPPQPVIEETGNILFTGSVATSYQWFLDGSPIPGATNDTLAITQFGSYAVTITDSNGCSSTSLPLVVGGKVTTVVAIPQINNMTAGEQVMVPLLLRSITGLIPPGTRTFTAQLRFNRSLLTPSGATPKGSIVGNERIITVTGSSILPADTLMNVGMIATLGDDTCTAIYLDTFYWHDLAADVVREDGRGCLDGICFATGRPRLIHFAGKTIITPPYPNPSSGLMTLEYGIGEAGRMRLFITDIQGKQVHPLIEEDAMPGTYSILVNTEKLAEGTYMIVLHTASRMRSVLFQVVK